MKKFICFMVILGVFLGMVKIAEATNIYVPGSYTTIQAAINAATTGDTVLVANGTYIANINFNGKAITVQSVHGTTSTIINGNASGSVVTFNSREGTNSVLTGFTITNGSVGSDAFGGGGISCYSSSPQITNCTISNNAAVNYGGGIFCRSSSPTITNCTISNNSVVNHGGGIFCWNSSSPKITNCTISGNSAGGRGGGIFCLNDWPENSSPQITNCTISGNSAGYHGGGIYYSSSSLTITNCTISGNWAGYHGGGIYYSDLPSLPSVINSILWGDSPQEIYLYYSGSSINITYSNIQGGWAGEGNINANPLFVGGNDYHLTEVSPCINAGSNTAPGIPSTDKDGNSRIVNGTVDMGAYEFQGTPTITIITASLPSGTVNTYYQSTLTATGGTPPYTWSYSGSLPSGLNLNSSTGIISGVPTGSGTFIFIAEVKDNDTPQQTATKSITIVIGPREYWITLDEHDQPLPGVGKYYYNWTGGDRGMLNEGDIEYSWNGKSVYTANVVKCAGLWTYGGMWQSLIRINRDNIPLDFKAIFGQYVKPGYQGEIVEVEIVVSNATSSLNNTNFELRFELKDKNELKIYSKSWTDLIPNFYPRTYTVSLNPSQIGDVECLLWIIDNAKVGDSVSIDRVRLKARVPDLPTEEQAFLWTYSWLMANYDSNTGIVQDRSNFGSGDFENISASAKTAKIVYYAYKKGYTTYEDAKTIITKIADTLIKVVPQGPTGTNTLWPHFTKTGGTIIIPDTEWASGDTAYAALDIITALQMLGDPQNQINDLVNYLQNIDWDAMLLANGGISHGYDYQGQLLPNSWKGFGAETIGVNWAYASAQGKVTQMENPPSDNGSGFIDNAHYPMVFSGLDGWGNDWDVYRGNMADKQIAWYSTPEHYNKYICEASLFGLSAAEIPERDGYKAYGIGGKYEPSTDGNGEVVALHYSGMIADIKLTEAKSMWESLLYSGIISPLNNMESLRVNKDTGTRTINHLKGSWNLALQAEGWAMADSNIRNDLGTAIQNNTFLKKGYDLLKIPKPNIIITKKAKNVTRETTYEKDTSVLLGDIVEFKILVENRGLGTATDVIGTDKVPDGLIYTGTITGKGADDSQKPNLKWNIGTMVSNSSEILTFQSKVAQPYTRECEYPDEWTVGGMIWRSNASESKVHGQFGCEGSPPYSGKAGYVKYKNINLPGSEHLYLTLRYSKNSSSSVPIRVYLDEETTPRASFYPVNQGNWNSFTETAAIDLGAVTTGIHSIKFETNGQQYGVADLDKFTIF
ncbi:MAG: choice-of-anchor Q domain-containing protein [bacterium]|nr:choice-of-anchor Q domain-containing protein [bacterium]